MASLFSKALVYLGLVDEDQPDFDGDNNQPDQSPYEPRSERRQGGRVEGVRAVEGRRVEPPTRPGGSVMVRQGPPVRTVRPIEVQSDILVLEEFGDAKVLADRIRDRVPVVLDLRRIDSELVRRVVDFSSGLIYALDGTMRKVGEGLVLVLPPRVTLSRDEVGRLRDLGAYEISDLD